MYILEFFIGPHNFNYLYVADTVLQYYRVVYVPQTAKHVAECVRCEHSRGNEVVDERLLT
jgi:hypothetical protein